MKILSSTLFLLLIYISSFCQKIEQLPVIRVNQIGYFPKAVKKALVIGSGEKEFEIKKQDGTVVYKGKLSDSAYWDKSGENVRLADFSKLSKPGTYYLFVKGVPNSCLFQINDDLYKEAFIAVLKNFYYQRSGIEIEEKYAGKWSRKLGHPDTLCYFHPSSMRGSGSMSSSKGWYDAGDCNKYVVNAGVSVGTILSFFEMYPKFVPDAMTNIPESGNGISDLLDEIKFELDWVLTMQMPDGASNMKLSSRYFTGFIMPENDTTSRFVVGKATAPTLNLAAMTAQASRLFKTVDPEYSSRCLVAAEKAWQWAVKNPDVLFKSPKDVWTGVYFDKDLKEEFWWAAAELYLTTQKVEYLKYLTENEPYVDMVVGESWRNFVGNLGSFSLLLAKTDLKDLKPKIKTKLISVADSLLLRLENNPYRIFLDDFQWGSNSDILNSAMIFAYAYKLTKDKRYFNAIVESTDYIFGKNATGYSFVTGYGSKSPMFIHHRPSGADGIDEPIPGFVVGGPNFARQDRFNGVKYESETPAKSYSDVVGSFASNEVCLNWNAPAVFVLGFLEANAK